MDCHSLLFLLLVIFVSTLPTYDFRSIEEEMSTGIGTEVKDEPALPTHINKTETDGSPIGDKLNEVIGSDTLNLQNDESTNSPIESELAEIKLSNDVLIENEGVTAGYSNTLELGENENDLKTRSNSPASVDGPNNDMNEAENQFIVSNEQQSPEDELAKLPTTGEGVEIASRDIPSDNSSDSNVGNVASTVETSEVDLSVSKIGSNEGKFGTEVEADPPIVSARQLNTTNENLSEDNLLTDEGQQSSENEIVPEDPTGTLLSEGKNNISDLDEVVAVEEAADANGSEEKTETDPGLSDSSDDSVSETKVPLILGRSLKPRNMNFSKQKVASINNQDGQNNNLQNFKIRLNRLENRILELSNELAFHKKLFEEIKHSKISERNLDSGVLNCNSKTLYNNDNTHNRNSLKSVWQHPENESEFMRNTKTFGRNKQLNGQQEIGNSEPIRVNIKLPIKLDGIKLTLSKDVNQQKYLWHLTQQQPSLNISE